MFTKNWVVSLLCVAGVLAIASEGRANVIHSGQANPTTEGWTMELSPGSGSVSAGQEDINGRRWNYWQIQDADDGCLYYTQAAAAIFADADGWTMTGVLRASGPISDPCWPVNIAADNGTIDWNMTFYNGADYFGEGVYSKIPGSGTSVSQLKTMDISSDYHIYQMLYNVAGNNVDVYVDGDFVITRSASQNPGTWLSNKAQFGSGSTAGTSTANYAYVGLEAGHHVYSDLDQFSSPIPEPSTVVLLAAGLIGLLAYAWRKRK